MSSWTIQKQILYEEHPHKIYIWPHSYELVMWFFSYWRSHPGIIWGILGWWGTTGNAFGITNSVPGFSPGLTLPQALSNTRTDGLGELYREGTASFLNSLVNHKFPYTTDQVRERFASSLHSNKAAATQAHLFKMANEGKMKPRTWN